MAIRAVGLAVLLVMASGCSGLSGAGAGGGPGTASVTPAPVPETDAVRYPPWAPAGDVNASALLKAHDRALADGYTARVVWNRTVEERDLDIRRLTVRSTLWMGADRYRLRTSATLHREDASYDVDPAGALALRLGDGTDVYGAKGSEFVRLGGESFERRPRDPARYRTEFRAVLAEFLRVANTQVTPTARNGETWYRIEGSGRADDGLASDYRLRALVSSEGAIRRLYVTYILGRSAVTVRVRVSPGATVEPPAWLPTARAVTNTTGTGT